MNDLQAARSDAAFACAQAAYDHMEPPEEPECPVCDGTGTVVVASIRDVDGKEHSWPADVLGGYGPEIECPWCGYGASEKERIRKAKEQEREPRDTSE